MLSTGVSKPSSVMPVWIDCMMSAPKKAPKIVPVPPESDVPPITAAAMT